MSKINSIESIESIGFGAPYREINTSINVSHLPKLKEFHNAKLEPEGGGVPIDEYVYNCIGLVIYCPRHNKILLSTNERSRASWFPFVTSPPNKTWSDATTDGIATVFSKDDSEFDPRLITPIPVKSINCLHILRIQLPITKKFICRLIQLVTLGNNTDSFKCCQNSRHLQWINIHVALDGGSTIPGLWGPEVPIFASFIVNTKQSQEINEYSLNYMFLYVPKENMPKSPEEKILAALQISEKNIEQIYSDFLEYCFPSFYMTYCSFFNYIQNYIQEYDNPATLLQLFIAFDFHKNGYLSFHEFLLGIASIEPDCPNNEIRLKFIFRFYDIDRDELLNREEFLRLLQDLRISKPDSELLLESINIPINWVSFIEIVEMLPLKTELLCRSSSPILMNICANVQKRNDIRISSKNVDYIKQEGKGKGPCLACRERKYEFGTHCVRFDQTGRCVEPRHILEHDVTNVEEEISNEMSLYRYSQDYVFSTVSIGHTFLDMIREYNAQGKKEKIGFFSGSENSNLFIIYLKVLCQNVSSLLECETNLIKINSPAFVIGDILGDLESLIHLERALWQSIPVTHNNYVFLGNYVNIQKSRMWGIECTLYMFALKIVAPNKIFLLRGNNETRRNKFFQNECMEKYGIKNGLIVFDILNEVFDKMSLAIIIDESVLCVNSGVPESNTTIEDIYNISKNLKDPMNNNLAKDILTTTTYDDSRIFDYLERNGLSYVIRSNKFLEKGYQFDINGKSINIFTVTNISGKNELTVVCVDDNKIQLVQIDTQIERIKSKEQ